MTHQEDDNEKPSMFIAPDGLIFDYEWHNLPRAGQRVEIDGRLYRVVEAHESMSARWRFVIQLGRC